MTSQEYRLLPDGIYKFTLYTGREMIGLAVGSMENIEKQ